MNEYRFETNDNDNSVATERPIVMGKDWDEHPPLSG
jgi:hypothetical protein